MPDWLRARDHRYYVSDDLIVVELHGALELAEARLFLDSMMAIVQRHGYSLTLCDVSAGASVPPDTRRYIGEWGKQHKHLLGTTVLYGTNVVVRTVVTLLNNAIRLLSKGAGGDLILVKNEQDGWAAIARRRAHWQTQVARLRVDA